MTRSLSLVFTRLTLSSRVCPGSLQTLPVIVDKDSVWCVAHFGSLLLGWRGRGLFFKLTCI